MVAGRAEAFLSFARGAWSSFRSQELQNYMIGTTCAKWWIGLAACFLRTKYEAAPYVGNYPHLEIASSLH